MQIMPATARWIAKRLGVKDHKNPTITRLETNIEFGTYYLKHVQDLFGGDAVLATAGYNAGPSRAKRWRDERTLEGAVYAETIPFNETRDYVKKVMSNAVYYASRFGQQMVSLKQRLGTIAGKSGESGDGATEDEP
jgi:soluble lytic murein transglycosylase